jgi:hypothetical protein
MLLGGTGAQTGTKGAIAGTLVGGAMTSRRDVAVGALRSRRCRRCLRLARLAAALASVLAESDGP